MKKVLNYQLVATMNNESRIAAEFFAPDAVAAAKVARAFVKTIVAADKNATAPLTRDHFKLYTLKKPS